MKTHTSKSLLAIVAFALIACGAHAHLIHIGSFDLSRPLGNPASEAEWIEDELGLDDGILTYLNKWEEGDGWENSGVVDDSHFDIDLDDDDSGSVWWDLSGTGYELDYLLVKSGRGSYNLYGVSADQLITSAGWDDFDNDGAAYGISHGSFFGGAGTSVPDGGATLALLALGTLGIGALKRFRKP